MGWGNHHRGHKTTLVCPIKKCKYHSRRFISMNDWKNVLSNSSAYCPIHRMLLIDVGSSRHSVRVLKKVV